MAILYLRRRMCLNIIALRDAWSINEGALLVDDVDNSDEPVLEGPDTDVGDAANLDKIVEDTDSHFSICVFFLGLKYQNLNVKFAFLGFKIFKQIETTQL